MKHATSAQRVLMIAALANADPRTVRRLLQGGAIRGAVKERIEAAIKFLENDAKSTSDGR